MNIQCPECETVYNVSDAGRQSPVRKFRCAICQNVWSRQDDASGADSLFTVVDCEDDAPNPDGTGVDGGFENRNPDFGMEAAKGAAEAEDANLRNTPANRTDGCMHSHASEPQLADGDGRIATERSEEPAFLLNRDASSARDAGAHANRRPWSLIRQSLRSRFGPSEQSVAMIAVSAAILLVIFGAKTWLVGIFPGSSGFYASLGLDLPPPALVMQAAVSRIELRNKKPTLFVRGTIVNEGRARERVKPVRISLLDARSNLIYSWGVAPDTTVLLPGESVVLASNLPEPPETARKVRIEFQDGLRPAIASQFDAIR